MPITKDAATAASTQAPTVGPAFETGRLEAFSDGVFSVAITLLVLDLHKQTGETNAAVAHSLLSQWPSYLTYGLSFLTILIMWINHHSLFKHIKRVDHAFLVLNGLLLMIISVVPFTTSQLAEGITNGGLAISQEFYSAVNLVMAVVYNRMWSYASYRDRLLDDHADRVLVDSITRAYRVGPPLYITALVLAFISPIASLGLCILLALFFALPSTVTQPRTRA